MEVIKMLKGIPTIISPDLMKVLMEMGHGDEIVITDGNFPATSCAKNLLVRCDGHNVPEVLDAVLQFLPLDTYSDTPVGLMAVVPGDTVVPVIWDKYKDIIKENENREVEIEYIERFEFYERAKKAFAIVYTSERAQYANIILRKGVIKQ
jgi:L-fucose mutarotase